MHTAEAAPGTAASAEAAVAAAVAALREDREHATPPTSGQKKADTKAANDARREWVEAQWIDISPPRPSEPEGCAPSLPPTHQIDPQSLSSHTKCLWTLTWCLLTPRWSTLGDVVDQNAL